MLLSLKTIAKKKWRLLSSKGFYLFWNFFYTGRQNQYFSLSLFFKRAIFNTSRLSISAFVLYTFLILFV